jgi:hypothetical protein
MQGVGPTMGLIFHAFYMAEGVGGRGGEGGSRLPTHTLKQAKI